MISFGNLEYLGLHFLHDGMEVGGTKGPAFFQLILYNKDLKHIKTGNYSIKYGNKLSSASKWCVKSEAWLDYFVNEL